VQFSVYCIFSLPLFETTLANEPARNNPRLMFRAAKITFRIDFHYFDQFHDHSTRRTFHMPAVLLSSPKARYQTISQSVLSSTRQAWARVESSRVELYRIASYDTTRPFLAGVSYIFSALIVSRSADPAYILYIRIPGTSPARTPEAL